MFLQRNAPFQSRRSSLMRFLAPLSVTALLVFPTLAFISWEISSRHVSSCLHRSNRTFQEDRSSSYPQKFPKRFKTSNRTQTLLKKPNKYSSNTKSSPYRSRRGRQQERNRNLISKQEALSIVRSFGSSKEINDWISNLSEKDRSTFASWDMKDQNDFIRLLKDCHAFDAILTFVNRLALDHVFVYTTAMFAVAVSSNQRHRDMALILLDQMDERGIEPTPLTFTALLGSVDGPIEVLRMMSRFKRYQDAVQLTDSVFDSAIFACGRYKKHPDHPTDSTWQTALSLFHQMRGLRITPTTKTYLALIQVLGQAGQVKIALSILDGLRNIPEFQIDDRVWGALINVCAQAADYKSSIQVIRYMQEDGYKPNLWHCSTMLKSMSRSGQYRLALHTLQVMIDGGTITPSRKTDLAFTLPPVQPDIVALNTVMAACSRAGNYNATKALFDRVRSEEFLDPHTGRHISPDRISYHSVLAACRNPELAKELVKEVSGILCGTTVCPCCDLLPHPQHRTFSSFCR